MREVIDTKPVSCVSITDCNPDAFYGVESYKSRWVLLHAEKGGYRIFSLAANGGGSWQGETFKDALNTILDNGRKVFEFKSRRELLEWLKG